jgi:RHS repeat-associated protein
MWFPTNKSRFPMYDAMGSLRRMVDGSGTVTDKNSLDAFGRYLSGSMPSSIKYQYGAEWGYITDPSGMLQLGARFYWPEMGRFVQRDPGREYRNDYSYGGNAPLARIDPNGEWAWSWGEPPSGPVGAPMCRDPEMAYPCIELGGVGSGSYGIYWTRYPKHKPKAPYVPRPPRRAGCRRDCYNTAYLPALKRKCKECFDRCNEESFPHEGPYDASPIAGFVNCVQNCMSNARRARVKSSINAHQEYLDAIRQCQARQAGQ